MKKMQLKEEIVFCQSEGSLPDYLTPESKVKDISIKRRETEEEFSWGKPELAVTTPEKDIQKDIGSAASKESSPQAADEEKDMPASTGGTNLSRLAAGLKRVKVEVGSDAETDSQNLAAVAKKGVGRFSLNPCPPAATVHMDQVAEMLTRSGLDPSQQAALVHGLTHRLAIIQGPPGCGKTFVGIRLVQLLLSMEPRPPLPILVLTYKNHALDEFLKGLLAFLSMEDMVRIGGRSQVRELDSCNLRNLDLRKQDQKFLDEINALREERWLTHEQVGEQMLELQAASTLTLEDLLEVWSEEQLRHFLLEAPYSKNTGVSVWFAKGRPANKKTVQELLADVPSLSDLLTNGLENGWNTKQEKIICRLFMALMTYWVPSASCFAQLKSLQAQVVNQARVDQMGLGQTANNEEEEEEMNEEIVESIMEARLSAQGKSGKRTAGQQGPRTDIAFFSQTQHKSQNLVVHSQDFPPNLEESEELLGVPSLWDLNDGQKICLLYTVLSQKLDEVSCGLSETLDQLEVLTKSLSELTAERKACALKNKMVIGMTISGASINHQLIKDVSPAIVIVEEAAEVLEADLLAALTPGLQHLILIGDHKQLRPKVDTYSLKADYSFDVSMMERLIGNQLPFTTLAMQNRMRPEFSQLLRDIYPDLQDNLARVLQHQPAEAVMKSMLFWSHRHVEQSGRSISNLEEARRAVFLAEFLMASGIEAKQITILAAYQGQVTQIRNLISTCGGGPNVKLVQQEENKVQVCTIDMFQGDENDFIIVSLVRSNPSAAIGFLMEESRRCVAQSRARCGMYLIGNPATLTQESKSKSKSPWIPLLRAMRDGNWVSNTLDIQCVKHKGSAVASVADADALEGILQKPARLCKQACGVLYSCGVHACIKTCIPVHAHASCISIVPFNHPVCGHQDEKRCHEDASRIRCKQPVLLEFSSCDHKMEVNCYQKRDHDRGVNTKSCKVMVVCVLPTCRHGATKPCHTKLSDVICHTVVNYKGACGHDLSRECHMSVSQVHCQFRPCARQRSCGHPCVNKCYEPCDQGPCVACQLEQEQRHKKNQHRAKIRMRQLQQQIEESGGGCSRTALGEEDPEYMSVYDRVMKYILPMHNW